MCRRSASAIPTAMSSQRLRTTCQAQPFEGWPCYHTALDTFVLGVRTVGIIGCAVGAPFAVLVAEELFACRGRRLLLSVTSAGQIASTGRPPYVVVIDLACATKAQAITVRGHRSTRRPMLAWLRLRWKRSRAGPRVIVGSTWTTDAPFRETAGSDRSRQSKGALAVEMKAAALYSFARAARCRSSALPTSPTRWAGPRGISRRARPTAPPTRWRCWKPIAQRVTNEQVCADGALSAFRASSTPWRPGNGSASSIKIPGIRWRLIGLPPARPVTVYPAERLLHGTTSMRQQGRPVELMASKRTSKSCG